MTNHDAARRAIEKAGQRLRAGELPAEAELESYDAVAGQFDLERLWRRIRRSTDTRRRRRTALVAAAGVAAAAVALLLIVPLRREPVIYPRRAESVSIAVGDGADVNVGRDMAEIAVGDATLRNDTVGAVLHYESVASPEEESIPEVTLTVPRGGEYSVILPDGTRVWLDSETTLRFPDRFGADSRDVDLEGEAFFDVATDPQKPFNVHAGGYRVTAVGTEFNVDARMGSDSIVTALLSGVVEVGGATLAPGQLCVVDTRDGGVRTMEADVRRVAGWREGKVWFVGWTMEQIAARMALWYDFEMVWADPEIAAMRFSGTIDRRRSLNELLDLMEQIGPLRFDIEGRQVFVERK